MQTSQRLTLHPNDDEKKWVAEITGEDPAFKLKRTFLPEIEPNTYEIYDGFYQIHGTCPGVTPFQKEYCVVENGHMQRRWHFGQVMQKLDTIKAMEPQRIQRVKQQLNTQLDAIKAALNDERVDEDIMYQKEQIDMMDEFDQLASAYSQLMKQKKDIIKRYEEQLANQPKF